LAEIFLYDAFELYMSPIYISMIVSITVAFLWVQFRVPSNFSNFFPRTIYRVLLTIKPMDKSRCDDIYSQILLSVKKQLYPPDDEEGSSIVNSYSI
jgi:hypothetical protein